MSPQHGSDRAGGNARDRILQSAVGMISEGGVDSVNATALARRVDISRPTLYSYFGDSDGVLAEVWLNEGAAWLERLADGTEPAPARGAAPDPILELFAVAPRIGALTDVVVPDLAAIWRARTTSSAASVRLAWVLGIEVGVRLAAPTFPPAPLALGGAAMMRGLPDDWTTPGGLTARRILEPINYLDPSPWLASGDETVDRLLDASIRVVATSGVAGASVQRIARVARVTTGAVRPRFNDLPSLLEDGLRYAVARVVAENRATGFEETEDPWVSYAGFIAGALRPQRRIWRRYRHELYVSALHDDGMKARVAGAIEMTDGDVRQIIERLSAEPLIRDVMMATNQAGTLGLSLLHELGLPVAEVDHRIGLAWFREEGRRLLGI